MLRRVTALGEPPRHDRGASLSLHVLAAAASSADNSAILVVAVIAPAVYLASVWINPSAPCRWCKGSPKTYGGSRFAARPFPRDYDLR